MTGFKSLPRSEQKKYASYAISPKSHRPLKSRPFVKPEHAVHLALDVGPLEDQPERRAPRAAASAARSSAAGSSRLLDADVFERPPLNGLERQHTLKLREELLALLQVVVPS